MISLPMRRNSCQPSPSAKEYQPTHSSMPITPYCPLSVSTQTMTADTHGFCSKLVECEAVEICMRSSRQSLLAWALRSSSIPNQTTKTMMVQPSRKEVRRTTKRPICNRFHCMKNIDGVEDVTPKVQYGTLAQNPLIEPKAALGHIPPPPSLVWLTYISAWTTIYQKTFHNHAIVYLGSKRLGDKIKVELSEPG